MHLWRNTALLVAGGSFALAIGMGCGDKGGESAGGDTDADTDADSDTDSDTDTDTDSDADSDADSDTDTSKDCSPKGLCTWLHDICLVKKPDPEWCMGWYLGDEKGTGKGDPNGNCPGSSPPSGGKGPSPMDRMVECNCDCQNGINPDGSTFSDSCGGYQDCWDACFAVICDKTAPTK